jgi:hypothetical protein
VLNERLRQWIDQLLAEADAAAAEDRWVAVRRAARSVLAYDPGNARARAHLEAADLALGNGAPAERLSRPFETARRTVSPAALRAAARVEVPSADEMDAPTGGLSEQFLSVEQRAGVVDPEPGPVEESEPARVRPSREPRHGGTSGRVFRLLTRELALFTIGMGIIGLVEVLSPAEAPGSAATIPGAASPTAVPVRLESGGVAPVPQDSRRNPGPTDGDPTPDRADAVQDFTAWPLRFGWSSSASGLSNDGSDFGDANWIGDLWNAHWVPAPAPIPIALGNYAVEAEIRVVNRPACGSFGLVVGEAYQVGAHLCSEYAKPILSIRSSAPGLLLATPFDPEAGWHRYRVEVAEGTVRALVDGVELGRIDDLMNADSRVVGLWSDHTGIIVRAFHVLAL